MKRSKLWDVSGAVVIASVFHFIHSCASGCLLPFLTLYLRHLGLTASMTGIVMGAKRLIALVWSPVSASLAKRYNRRRLVIMGSLLCSLGASLCLLLIPPTDTEAQSRSCNESRSRVSVNANSVQGLSDLRNLSATLGTVTVQPSHPLEYTNSSVHRLRKTTAVPLTWGQAAPSTSQQHETNHGVSLAKADVVPVSKGSSVRGSAVSGGDRSGILISERKIRSLLSLSEGEQETVMGYEFLGSLKVMDVQHQIFFLVLIVVMVWEVLAVPLECTADDGLFEYLDFVDATDRHGKARGWSLLGAAFGVCGAGLLVGSLECFVSVPKSAFHFYCYAAFMAFALPAAAFLPLYVNKKRERYNRALKALQLVQRDPRALLCAVTAFVVGAATSAVDDFLLWQMQDHGSSELHMGMALGLALLSRAAFGPVSWRVAKLLNHGSVLLVGTMGLAFQCLYYSFLWSPWSALPVQVLSALSGGALWWAVGKQCEDIATPGMERCIHSVFHSLSLNLGAGLASVAGGFVVQRFGSAVLFRGAAATLLLWSVCLLAFHSRIPHQRRVNYSRLLVADGSEVSESESDQEKDWLEKAMEDDKSNNNW